MARTLYLVCCIFLVMEATGSMRHLLVFPYVDELDPTLDYQIMISTLVAEASVQVIAANMSKSFSMKGNQPVRLHLNMNDFYLTTYFEIEKKAVLILSDEPIIVQGYLQSQGSAGGYTSIPLHWGSKRFIVPAYIDFDSTYNSDIIFAALSDNTRVKVSYTNGSSSIIILPAFGTYSVKSKSDLTGTYVAANSSIALYSGHVCANVPVITKFCDRLIEGIPPLSYQGKNYIIPSVGGRSKKAGYVVRVLSVAPQESVHTGMHKEISFHYNIPRAFNCTEGCFVYLYNKGGEADQSKSDPFMMRVVPVTQYANPLIWITPMRSNVSFGDQFQHYVSIIVPTVETFGVHLDRLMVNQSQWPVVENSIFSVITLSIKNGLHTIHHDKSHVKMAAYAYGHGQKLRVGYGFPAGGMGEGVSSDGSGVNDEKRRKSDLSQTLALYKAVLSGTAVTAGILLLVLIATWIMCFIKFRKRDRQGSSSPPRLPVSPLENVELGDERVYYTHLSGADHSQPHVYQSI